MKDNCSFCGNELEIRKIVRNSGEAIKLKTCISCSKVIEEKLRKAKEMNNAR